MTETPRAYTSNDQKKRRNEQAIWFCYNLEAELVLTWTKIWDREHTVLAPGAELTCDVLRHLR